MVFRAMIRRFNLPTPGRERNDEDGSAVPSGDPQVGPSADTASRLHRTRVLE